MCVYVRVCVCIKKTTAHNSRAGGREEGGREGGRKGGREGDRETMFDIFKMAEAGRKGES